MGSANRNTAQPDKRRLPTVFGGTVTQGRVETLERTERRDGGEYEGG